MSPQGPWGLGMSTITALESPVKEALTVFSYWEHIPSSLNYRWNYRWSYLSYSTLLYKFFLFGVLLFVTIGKTISFDRSTFLLGSHKRQYQVQLYTSSFRDYQQNDCPLFIIDLAFFEDSIHAYNLIKSTPIPSTLIYLLFHQQYFSHPS